MAAIGAVDEDGTPATWPDPLTPGWQSTPGWQFRNQVNIDAEVEANRLQPG